MKLLHLDTSILREFSVSRGLSALIVKKVMTDQPDITVTYHDLDEQELPHIRLMTIPADPDAPVQPDSQNPEQIHSEAVLEEFLQTDIAVIGAPMYNYTIPSQLKAWIDRIVIARKTFRYGPNGPEGLAGGKRVIIAIASGGIYRLGSPGAKLEYSESYLRALFSTIGITPEFIIADGLAMGPDAKAKSIAAAEAAIAALPA